MILENEESIPLIILFTFLLFSGSTTLKADDIRDVFASSLGE